MRGSLPLGVPRAASPALPIGLKAPTGAVPSLPVKLTNAEGTSGIRTGRVKRPENVPTDNVLARPTTANSQTAVIDAADGVFNSAVCTA